MVPDCLLPATGEVFVARLTAYHEADAVDTAVLDPVDDTTLELQLVVRGSLTELPPIAAIAGS